MVYFKQCSCGQHWASLNEFLADPAMLLNGYMVNFKQLELGLMLFTHMTQKCGTSLGIEADKFKTIYAGEVFTERKTGTDACPGHCLHKSDLQPCPARCEGAWVREIIQIIKTWPKTRSA